MRALPNEVELLYCCARARDSAARAARVEKLLEQDVSWERVLELARRHAVSPLVARSLRQLGVDRPPWLLEALRADCHSVTLHNLLAAEAMAALAGLLERSGIRALWFKGVALSALAYGDTTLRVTGDLDLLVAQADVVAVKALLEAQGYRPVGPLTKDLDRSRGALGFHHAASRLDLDLHWSLLAPELGCRLDFDSSWDDRQQVSVDVGTIPTFGRVDTALVQAIELAKDAWRGYERLKYVCDVAETGSLVADREWGLVLRAADDLGARRMLLLSHAVAHATLGSVLPAALQGALSRDGETLRLCEEVVSRLAGPAAEPRRDHSKHLFHLRCRERLRDRLRYGAHVFKLWLGPAAATEAEVAAPWRSAGGAIERAWHWSREPGLRRGIRNVVRLLARVKG